MKKKNNFNITSAKLKSNFSYYCRKVFDQDVTYSVYYYDKHVISLSKDHPGDGEQDHPGDGEQEFVGMVAGPTYYRQNWGDVFNSVIELGVVAEVRIGKDDFVYMYKNPDYVNIFYRATLQAWGIDVPIENKMLMYTHPIVILKNYADSIVDLRNNAKDIELVQNTLGEMFDFMKRDGLANNKKDIEIIKNIIPRLDAVVKNITMLEDFSRFMIARGNRYDISIPPETHNFAKSQMKHH